MEEIFLNKSYVLQDRNRNKKIKVLKSESERQHDLYQIVEFST